MATDFQEFLKQKTAGTDIRDRLQARTEWLGALNRLFEQIKGWISELDPDGLIEVEPYEIKRAESRLGLFDAPAIKIRLNTDEVTVLPVGRYGFGPLSDETKLAIRGMTASDAPADGRVDITNAERRRYKLFRDARSDPERWLSVDDRSDAQPLDRSRLEAILRDLWS